MSNGFLALEDGTVFRARSVGAPGVAFGEAVFTTAMTGYQETVTDPSYAEPDRRLHGADDRQLRRRRRRDSSRRDRSAKAVARCAAAEGRAWARDWLRAGIVALDEHRHARARAPPPRRGRDARCRGRGRRRARPSTRRSRRSARSRRWRAAALVGQVSPVEPTVYTEDGARARRRRRLRRQALDHAAARAGRRRGDRASRTSPGRTSSPRYDGVLLVERPGRPGAARRRGRSRFAACSGGRASSASASATSCSASRLGHETYKLPFGHRGANHPVLERATGRVLVTSQNHGFAVAADRRPRGHLRLALRRHRRGLRLPRAERALGAVPPRGRPGHARRLADPRAAGSTSLVPA